MTDEPTTSADQATVSATDLAAPAGTEPLHTEPLHTEALPAERRRPGLLGVVAGTAVVGTVSSLAVAGVAFADRGRDWGYRGDRHWMGLGGILLMLALIAATAAVTALIVSRRASPALPGGGAASVPVEPMSSMPPAPPAPPVSPTAAAEAILAERLARGEISPDDYRAGITALRGDPSTEA